MSAELAVLSKLRQNTDIYCVDNELFNATTMLDISGIFPNTDLTTRKIVLNLPILLTLKSTALDPFNDNSLINSYLFDDNVLDLLGNADGTVTDYNDIPTGAVYEAARFNNGIRMESKKVAFVAQPALSNFSYSVWITGFTNDSLNRYIIDNTTGRGILAQNNSTYTNVSFYDGVSWIDTGYLLPIGEMVYLTLTKTGTSWNFYVNSILTKSIIANDLTIADERYIGGGLPANADGAVMSGLLDQFMIFNRALTQDEVTNLYKMEA